MSSLANNALKGKIYLFHEGDESIESLKSIKIQPQSGIYPLESHLTALAGTIFSVMDSYYGLIDKTNLVVAEQLADQKKREILIPVIGIGAIIVSYCGKDSLKSSVCMGINYDSRQPHEVVTSIPPTQLINYAREQKNVIDQLQIKYKNMVIEACQKEEISAPPYPTSESRLIDEYSSNSLSNNYTLLWRNHMMIKRFSKKINEISLNVNKDVHIVLGANHVKHFKYALMKYYPSTYDSFDNVMVVPRCKSKL